MTKAQKVTIWVAAIAAIGGVISALIPVLKPDTAKIDPNTTATKVTTIQVPNANQTANPSITQTANPVVNQIVKPVISQANTQKQNITVVVKSGLSPDQLKKIVDEITALSIHNPPKVATPLNHTKRPKIISIFSNDKRMLKAGEKVTGTIFFANVGDASSVNGRMLYHMPAFFKFVSATNGGMYLRSKNTVLWRPGIIFPGDKGSVSATWQAIDTDGVHGSGSDATPKIIYNP